MSLNKIYQSLKSLIKLIPTLQSERPLNSADIEQFRVLWNVYNKPLPFNGYSKITGGVIAHITGTKTSLSLSANIGSSTRTLFTESVDADQPTGIYPIDALKGFLIDRSMNYFIGVQGDAGGACYAELQFENHINP